MRRLPQTSGYSYPRVTAIRIDVHPAGENPTQSTARRPSDPRVHTQLLSDNSQRAVGKSQAPVDNRLLGVPGPYHQHAIGAFNTCSRGPTEQSLIDKGGGYNLGGASLPHIHFLTFLTSYPHFPLMAPPGLYFNQILAKDQSVEFLKNI
jgi:hypothetical protein